MSINSRRETAKIIPFVPRARLAGSAARTAAVADHHAAAQYHPVVDWESGWYHEAAIQDEARDRRS